MNMFRISTHSDWHNYVRSHALGRYRHIVGQENMGTMMAVCSNLGELSSFESFPFEEIVVTGINPGSKDKFDTRKTDARVSYKQQNCECLEYESRSFDLVFCKEGLHHLSRPVLGLYEMLRVCRKAVVIIEPFDTILGKFLEKINLASTYETNQSGNITSRDNFVFRWNKRLLEELLNSYYLESGYYLEIFLSWMSTRYNVHAIKKVRRLFAMAAIVAGFVPFSRGNYMTALIFPGSDIPPDL